MPSKEPAEQHRARGTNVVMVEHEGQTHGGEQTNGVAGAVAFLDWRFSERHHGGPSE
ncbi:hypothetical protein ACFU8W_49945 [Streptomyces sp. NPDC057565]|uniref:hypothetical protein n=1 Tax=Streptomyces sp. NPDC057565 TaxID=3346169 RepID=UPI003696F5FB